MIGKIPEDLLEIVLNSIPIEFSIVDENDQVVAWNKHEDRIFRRGKGVVGKTVQACHPKRSLAQVEKILKEMKEGTREKARFWIDLPLGENKEKQKVMIEYYALRDNQGNYKGCLEASQNISEIQKLKDQQRLLE